MAKSKRKLVHEEIGEYLRNWRSNRLKTSSQEKIYPYTFINRDMLGVKEATCGKECIRMLKEDGWDGDYVGSVASRTASEYWWDKETRVRIKNRDLLRVCLFFHVDYYKTVILMIKNVWEKYLYEALKADHRDKGLKEFKLLQNFEDTDKYAIQFARDVDEWMKIKELYELFQTHNSFSSNNGYNEDGFRMLIHELTNQKAQTYNLDSEAQEKIIDELEKERGAIMNNESIIQKQFMDLKQEWLDLKNSIEQSVLLQDDINERNYKTKVEWGKAFGELEIERRTLAAIKNELEFLINIKESNPNLSLTDVKELANERIKQTKEKLEKEKKNIENLLSAARIIEQKNFMADLLTRDMPSDDMVKYHSKLMAMLRSARVRIYELTHPDKRICEKFTKKQENELLELYYELERVKKMKGLSAVEIMPLLDDLLQKAQKIWDNKGIDFDEYSLEVFPDDINKTIERLKEKIEALEEKDTQLKNEIFLLLHDTDISAKEIVLANTNAIEDLKDSYIEDIEKLKDDIKALSEALNSLFEEGFNYETYGN